MDQELCPYCFKLCQRHKEMVEVSLYVNTGRYEEAEEAFARYMKKF